MHREPDWNVLADLQFVLYNRIAGALNEALSSIALSDMPEAQDKPPGYWKERASNKIANVLNLFTAWSYLIRFKSGSGIPERAIRPFHINALLKWLGIQLQLNPIPRLESNPLLHANQETLQEALMLLYSVAYTQGAGVRVEVESNKLGAWFRVKFNRTRPMPKSIETLLASFGDHWRARDAAFELATARDFVRLNGSELKLITMASNGEFVFFVRAAGKERPQAIPVQTAAAPIPATQSPARTRPLDPAVVAAYKAKMAPGESTTPAMPDKKTGFAPGSKPAAAQKDATLIFSEAHVGKVAQREPQPPKLDMLRPLPPTLSELERRAAREAHDKSGAETPSSPAAAPETSGKPIIVPLRIPDPTLPRRMVSPPASTSNVALTRETQSLAPLTADQIAKAQRDAADDAGAAPSSDSAKNSAAPSVSPEPPETSGAQTRTHKDRA